MSSNPPIPLSSLKPYTPTADDVAQEASAYGLKITSGKRTPQHNAAVGGAKNSYHLRGQAYDVTGDPEQMKAFHQHMADSYGLAENLDEGDHIHVAGFQAKKPIPLSSLKPADDADWQVVEEGKPLTPEQEQFIRDTNAGGEAPHLGMAAYKPPRKGTLKPVGKAPFAWNPKGSKSTVAPLPRSTFVPPQGEQPAGAAARFVPAETSPSPFSSPQAFAEASNVGSQHEVGFSEPMNKPMTFSDVAKMRQGNIERAAQADVERRQAETNRQRQRVRATGTLKAVIGAAAGVPSTVVPDVVSQTAADVGGGLTSAVGSALSGEAKPSVFNPIKSLAMQIPVVRDAANATVGAAGRYLQDVGNEATDVAGAPEGSIRRDVGRSAGAILPALAARNPLAVGALAYDQARGRGASEAQAVAEGATTAASVAAMGVGGKAVSRLLPGAGVLPAAGRFAGRALTNMAAGPAVEAPLRAATGQPILPTSREMLAKLPMDIGFAAMPHAEGVKEPVVDPTVESYVLRSMRPPAEIGNERFGAFDYGKARAQYESQRAAEDRAIGEAPRLVKRNDNRTISSASETAASRAAVPADAIPVLPSRISANKSVQANAQPRVSDTAQQPELAPTVTTVRNASPRSPIRTEGLTNAIINLGGIRPDTPEGGDFNRYAAGRQGGRPGMMNRGGLGVDEMMASLEAEGYHFDSPSEMLDAVRREQQGHRIYGSGHDYDADVEKAYQELQESGNIEPARAQGIRAAFTNPDLAPIAERLGTGEYSDEDAQRFADTAQYVHNVSEDDINAVLEEAAANRENFRRDRLDAESVSQAGEQGVSDQEREAGQQGGDVNGTDTRLGRSGSVLPVKASTDQIARVSSILEDLRGQARESGQSLASLVEDRINQQALPGMEQTALSADDAALLREMLAPSPRRAPVAEKQTSLLDTAPTVESRQARTAETERAQAEGAANAPLFEGKGQEAKEPWQQTQSEFIDNARKTRTPVVASIAEDVWGGEHKQVVRRAVAEGKPVPPEVLRDYPDLVEHHSQLQPRDEQGQFTLASEKIKAPSGTTEGKAISLLHKEASGNFFNDPNVKRALGLDESVSQSVTHKALQEAIGNTRPETHEASLLQGGIEAIKKWAQENNLPPETQAKITRAAENARLGGRVDDPDVIQRYRAELGKKSSQLSGTLLSDPEGGYKAAVVLGYDLYRNVKDFGVWSRKMVGQMGEKIRPYLREVWNKVKNSDFVQDERGFVRFGGTGISKQKDLGDLFKTRERIPVTEAHQTMSDAWDEFVGSTEPKKPTAEDLPRAGEAYGEPKAKPKDKVFSLRTLDSWMKANMLQGASPYSHKVGSLASNAVAEAASTPTSAAADWVISKATGGRRTVVVDPRGMARAAGEAVTTGTREAFQILRNGATKKQIAEYGMPNELNTRNPVINAMINYTFRSYKAGAHIFGTMAYQKALSNQAKSWALNEVTAGKIPARDVAKRTQEIVAGKGVPEGVKATMEGNATLAYADAVFQSDNALNNVRKNMIGDRNGAWAFAVNRVVPFMKSASNAYLKMLDYSGVGPKGAAAETIRAISRKAKTGTAFKTVEDQRAMAQAWGKLPVGMALFAAGVALHRNGLLTSLTYQHDDNPQPGSIRAFGKLIDVARYSPIGLIMAAGATFDEMNHDKGKDPLTAAIGVAAKGASNLPLMQQTTDLIDTAKKLRDAKADVPQMAVAGASRILPTMIPGYATVRDVKAGIEKSDEYVGGPVGKVLHVRNEMKAPRSADAVAVHDAYREANPPGPITDLKKPELDAKSEITRAIQSHDPKVKEIIQKHVKSGAISEDDVFDLASSASKSSEEKMIGEFKKLPLEQKLETYSRLSPEGRAKVKEELEDTAFEQFSKLTPMQQKALGPKLREALRAQ